MARTIQNTAPIQADAAQNESDDLLAERARWDPLAFAVLYDRHFLAVYRYLFTKVSRPADAEDLTSQVFLAALEALPTYHSQGTFHAWLLGIARRKTADFYRKHARQVSLEESGDLPSPAGPPLAAIVHSESLRRLAALIATLEEESQELLRLRFAAQLSFKEIAQVTGKKESAVKMTLYRLLERLEGQMEVDQRNE